MWKSGYQSVIQCLNPQQIISPESTAACAERFEILNSSGYCENRDD